MSLRRYSLRSMQLRLGRTILTLLSIVIGVSASVAVSLLAETTRGAYQQMFATVTGKATLEVDTAGDVGFDEGVLDLVENTPGVQVAAPLVKRPSKLFVDKEHQVRLQVMGIDPERDSGVRSYKIVAGEPLGKGDELLLDEEFAKRMEVGIGDEVGLLTKRLKKPFKIVGLLRPQGAEVLRQASLVFMPLERAQYHFNPKGQRGLIDTIQIVTDEKSDVDEVAAAIQPQLPTAVSVHPPGGNSQGMQETLMSSEQGLQVTSFTTLLLALFIILNTFMMNVGERRRHLAIMRAIGATRDQIVLALVGEAVILGFIGSLLGMVAGLGGAYLLNTGLAQALDVQMPPVSDVLSWQPFALGALMGIGMAVVGAIIPAVRAGKVSPLEGLSRVNPSDHKSWSKPVALLGALIVTVSGGLVVAGIAGVIPIDVAIYAGLVMLIGIVCVETQLIGPQARFVTAILRPLGRIEAELALRQTLRQKSRSVRTIGIVFLCAAAGITMASSILDNVGNVRQWFVRSVQGDYFLRAMLPDMASGTAADLPDGLFEEVEKMPHITAVEGVAFIQARILGEKEDQSDAVDSICIARTLTLPGPLPFDLIEGNPDTLREQLVAGEVVVASVLAQKRGFKLGDEIPMETKEGTTKLKVCGVANDYLVGGLAVYMYRPFAERYLGVEGFDGIVVKAESGHVPDLAAPLTSLATKYDVLLHSNADLSNTVDRIVRGIEAGLWALIYLCFIVAAFGVVNTLAMNVLEQTREIGLLRIVAMTKKQVRRTILFQALIIAGVSLPPGILAGVGIAWLMNKTMEPSFGHPIEFQLHPWLLVATFFGALAIVLVAAIVPARRATRIDVVDALRYE